MYDTINDKRSKHMNDDVIYACHGIQLRSKEIPRRTNHGDAIKEVDFYLSVSFRKKVAAKTAMRLSTNGILMHRFSLYYIKTDDTRKNRKAYRVLRTYVH